MLPASRVAPSWALRVVDAVGAGAALAPRVAFVVVVAVHCVGAVFVRSTHGAHAVALCTGGATALASTFDPIRAGALVGDGIDASSRSRATAVATAAVRGATLRRTARGCAARGCTARARAAIARPGSDAGRAALGPPSRARTAPR